MLKTIEVVFDGKNFVPTEPVDLPAGTKANVSVAERGVLAGPPPSPMTAEQKQDWERLCQLWAATPLPWATVDDAVAAMRKPSWLPPEDGS